MKSFLQCKIDRLMAQRTCPLCNSHKNGSYNRAEVDEGLIGTFAPNPDDLAAIKFFCGAELSIDEDERVRSRCPCTFAMRDGVDAIASDAELTFEDQEQAA